MIKHNKQQQAYVTPVKDKLQLLTGKVITLNTYDTNYPVEFIEPLLFYMAYGLPDKLDTNTLTSYFNQHYTKGTPLNKIGLHLITHQLYYKCNTITSEKEVSLYDSK